MFGHMACRVLSAVHDVYGTCRGEYDRVPIQPVVGRERCFDNLAVGDETRLHEVLAVAKPDVLINCIGVVKQRPEAGDAITQIEVNALFPHQAAALADTAGAKLIQLSTDCVFSGKNQA